MNTPLDPHTLDLNPDALLALAALHTAGLHAEIICADGGGYQIDVPAPGGTYILVGSPEVLPERGELLAGYHAQLHTPNGDFIAVAYNSITDPSDDTIGDPDPVKLAAGIVRALQNHPTAMPVQLDPDADAMAHAGLQEVIDAITFTDLEGGDILEDIKGRLVRLGFDLAPVDDPDE